MTLTPLPQSPDGKHTIVYDAEVFPNWFAFVFSDGVKWFSFTSDTNPRPDLLKLVNKNTALAGYNSFSYDDLILRAYMADPTITPERVHALSQRIIVDESEAAKERNFKMRYSETQWAYSIDVFQLLNGKGSLKEHACKMGVLNVAETPCSFGEPIPDHLKASAVAYCRIDVENTVKLLRTNWPLVGLRSTLKATFNLSTRVYASSEQSLAQQTFLKLHHDRTGEYSSAVRRAMECNPDNCKKTWHGADILAANVQFTTPAFDAIHTALMTSGLVAENDNLTSWAWNAPTLPEGLIVRLADADFQLGVGGLHSVDEAGTFTSDEEFIIVDLDVASFYPSIIVENKLYPAHIGPDFHKDMRLLRDRRLAAKKAGDTVTSDAIKVIVNSTFGHLNNRWSPLRSIPDALRITCNGQMYLLMLIEELHNNGAQILSANTDGVTFRWTRAAVELFLDGIITDWQTKTGFVLERADYAIYARRDVNNYLALTEKGKIKLKGSFQPEAAKGDGQVVKRAAIDFILQGVDPYQTIVATYNAEGVAPFLYYQRCKNGGELFHGTDLVGRLARWYSTAAGSQVKRRNPNGTFANIPNGESSTLAMQLTAGFTPIPDFNAYAARAHELIESVSMGKK